ncbi:MAG: Smr/MutS family protein [Polyangiaceae bacterium]|nr:Smr/MutS family protein [Polyangiaceae bacterium]
MAAKRESLGALLSGVRPLRAAPRRVPPATQEAAAPPPVVELQPLASPLEVTRDGEHHRGRAPGTRSRILQQLARGDFPPARTLNLHGLTSAEACRAVLRFVRDARVDGVRTLCIVHGRGTHSGARGAVLREEVARLLAEELAASVLAFSTAPPRFGAAGATLVRLRRLPVSGPRVSE